MFLNAPAPRRPVADLVAEQADAIRDAIAAVRAHLRSDAEGMLAVVNQSPQPRIALAVAAIGLSDVIAAIVPPLDDQGREQFLAEMTTRLTNATLDILLAASAPGGG